MVVITEPKEIVNLCLRLLIIRRFNMKYLLSILALVSTMHAITADELMRLHSVTTSQMNNISSPQAGSVVYNSTENTLFFYTGSVWKRMRANGSETIINAGNGISVTGNGASATPYVLNVN